MARRLTFDKFIGRFAKPRGITDGQSAPQEAPATPEDEAVRIYRPGGAPETEAGPPEKDEVFLRDEPLPFASYVQEILEEYRSDSSPTRYAMAVELPEPGEESFGPSAPEADDPFAAADKPLIQAFLSDAEDGELPTEPVAEPQPEAEPVMSWMDIIREYRAEHAPSAAGERSAVSGKERSPMTKREALPDDRPAQEQTNSDTGLLYRSIGDAPFELPAETTLSEDELPAGIRRLTERRAAPTETPRTAHLSVEDILAEFHGYVPAEEPEEGPVPVEEPPAEAEAEIEAGARPVSRRASLEAEARSLFSSFRLSRRESASEPEEEPEEGPVPTEEPPAETKAEPEAGARPVSRRTSLEAEARSLFSSFRLSRRESVSELAEIKDAEAVPDGVAAAFGDEAPTEASAAEAALPPDTADSAPVTAASEEAATPAAFESASLPDFSLPFLGAFGEEAPADTADLPAAESAVPAEDEAVFSAGSEAVPAEGPGESPASEETAAAEAEEPDAKKHAGLKAKLSSLVKRPGKKARVKGGSAAPSEEGGERVSGLRDTDGAPADYALEDDYETEEEPGDVFPSFGQYLGGLFAGLWVRIRGISPPANPETMEADEEDLGEELSPAAASRYYGAFVHSLRLRFRISLILWLVLLYISLGFPVSGMLRAVDVAAGMCLCLQLGIMLLCLDVVTGCAVNLARGRFGADSLAVLACLLTSFDALAVMVRAFGSLHVPLCLISSFSLIGVLYSSYLSARGLRKSLRVPAIGKRAYSVTAEDELTDRSVTLLKSDRPVSGFVRRSEEAAPDETAYNRAAPLLLILAILMSLVIVLVRRSPSHFLFVLSAVLAPAVPATALMSFAMPFFIGSQRIFTSGAAIAGWSGLSDIGNSHNLIVTDRDLFPENCVDIETIRIFADIPSEKIISYAGTMISASGSGLSPCFAELMERNGCTLRPVENFEFLPGGGMSGVIDGQTILCGGTELMRLMNVRIPYRLVEKTSVLLSIDGVLYGIFNIKYEPNPTVKKALVGLIRSNRHPVFAIRDFNVNPEMLHETFDVATDGYDFPPYVERFSLSDAKPSENRKIAGVLCREGLGPLVHMADTGRNMYLAVRINLMISLLASVFGVFAVFFLLLTKGTVALGALLLYALVWIIPVTLISLMLRI